jgi:hypothetical protein
MFETSVSATNPTPFSHGCEVHHEVGGPGSGLLPVRVLHKDPQGRFIFCNQALKVKTPGSGLFIGSGKTGAGLNITAADGHSSLVLQGEKSPLGLQLRAERGKILIPFIDKQSTAPNFIRAELYQLRNH